MRYTQSQVRDLLSISVDAFRAWRDAIPALATHKGHAPTFTPGDVVAVAIIAELVRDYGVRVGAIAERLGLLFAECHGRSWLTLENCMVLVGPSALRLIDADIPPTWGDEATTMVISCALIVSRLRASLVTTEAEQSQGYLKFPPTAVASR